MSYPIGYTPSTYDNTVVEETIQRMIAQHGLAKAEHHAHRYKDVLLDTPLGPFWTNVWNALADRLGD